MLFTPVVFQVTRFRLPHRIKRRLSEGGNFGKDLSGVRVLTARLVGAYAIQFDWSDGHNTGIFDFRFLRSLGTM